MFDTKPADFMSMVTRDVTNQLLVKNSFNELSNREMARLLNFDENEMRFVDMFWNHVHNNDWISVTRELVTTYLSSDYSKHAVKNFINRRLIKSDFKSEIDYRQILNPLRANGEPVNKQYYEITMKTFKHLLMKLNTPNGHIFREYMLKLERLVTIMQDYMVGLNQYRAKLYSDAIFEFMRNIKQFNTHNQPVAGYVYIASTDKYMKDNIYKIGSTIDISQRLSSLNTSHNIDDSLVVLKSYQTLFHREKELLIHRMLDSYRNSTRREFFTIEYTKLIEILDDILLYKCIE